MDISALSALGSSGVQASSLYALLSAFSASSGSDGDAGSSALQSDSLDISGAGWAASSGSGFNPLQQDMTRLGSLISSGDLTDAQTLLARIQQHLQAGPDGSASAGSDSSSTSSTSGTSGSSTLASDFTALATALSSGSTTSAQSVFQTLQSDLASLAPSGPPPPGPSPSGTGSGGGNPLQQDMNKLDSLAGGGTSASDSGQNAWLLSAYQAFSS